MKMTTPQSSVQDFFVKAGVIIHEALHTCFAKLGEEAKARIRDRSAEESWIDQTGNLRSSIGYAIYDHGKKELESVFEVVKNGGEGSQTGKDFIEQLAHEYATAYALVIVAGMNYASFVEAKDSKDVLASTDLWLRGVVDQRMKNAVDAATDRINSLSL